MGLVKSFIKKIGLDPNDRLIARYEKTVEIIDSYEPEIHKLSDEELAQVVGGLNIRHRGIREEGSFYGFR